MIADLLNRGCDCTVTDLPKLRERIETHAHVFAEMPVFLDSVHVSQMRRIVEAIEATTRLSAYREAVLGEAHELALIDPGACGVFMGFDFHITPAGPRLIEINTNAGGAFLNIAAQGAQRSCCPAADSYIEARRTTGPVEAEIVAMFRREWALARGDAPLRSIAIVDVEPRGQFLYPEFQLAQQLFQSHGLRAHIADPAELELADD